MSESKIIKICKLRFVGSTNPPFSILSRKSEKDIVYFIIY